MIKSIMTLALGFLLFSPVWAQQQQGKATNITLIVKDQNTGFALPGAAVQVTAPNGSTSTLTAAANGKLTFTAVNGRYDFSFAANGYKPLVTYFSSGAESNIEARINLEPVDRNARIQQLRVIAHQTVVSGYVRDDAGNTPLAGVQVSSGNANATTDPNGFFSLVIASNTPALVPGSTPEKATISFSKNGYTTHTIQNFYVIPDAYTMKIALAPVSAARMQQTPPAVEQAVHGLFDRTPADEQQRMAVPSAPTARVESTLAATVPTSIRVGLSCSCTSCSSVDVMSLEEYTGSGLDDEWIASWGAASLQAGAVAYRTYGAWYVLHPVASSFDIASTTCNQVWQSDKSTACINAASATAGIVLVKSGAIFRAEYSAENNNAGCGNGYSGTGSAWPCISDARCAGYAKNGHGRGMCQWGSSRWASDKDFTWILNHYYNPGSVYIQLPPTPALTVASFSVKDQSTGLAIASAAVTITKPDGTTSYATTNTTGQLLYGLDSGKYTFAFSKSGYKSISTFFYGGPNDSVYADINLDVASTARLAAGTTPLLTSNPNQMVLTGYARDGALNSALSGVQIQAGNYITTTDASGFFSLTVPANAIAPGQTPATISIRSTRAGYLTNSIQHLYAIPDTYEMQIALTPVTSFNATPLSGIEELVVRRHGLFDKTLAEQRAFADHPFNTARQESAATTLAALAVPTVIRVATSCACTACANPHVQVMSLESYVQTGVDDEWVSSWNAASLQAGTVAYRSRGAWFVQNPVASNYDISAAACHQTWQTDRATSVKNAAIATAGIVLIKNGAIYKAEYCAESNNAGCGDGFSGTGTGYPCISDSRCVGRTKSGAGRGMCQWGSSFWGTDQTYSWILNHYYNPDSAAIQTAVTAVTSDTKITEDRTLTIAPNPVTGSTITIEYTLNGFSQPASIVLTDNFGQSAQQRNVVLQQGMNRFSVNTSGLKPGIYNVTIRLNASGKSTSKKLLIVK